MTERFFFVLAYLWQTALTSHVSYRQGNVFIQHFISYTVVIQSIFEKDSYKKIKRNNNKKIRKTEEKSKKKIKVYIKRNVRNIYSIIHKIVNNSQQNLTFYFHVLILVAQC